MLDEEKSLDITGAEHVEVTIRSDGLVMWVNVDGTLALRVCYIKNITVNDERPDDGTREYRDAFTRGFLAGELSAKKFPRGEGS
jgi:hypothetical protein